jgi:hypothetical protein
MSVNCWYVADSEEADTTVEVACNSRDVMPVSSKRPPEKKSRLLGNVDLNSSEIQKLISAKSTHAALADEVSLFSLYLICVFS